VTLKLFAATVDAGKLERALDLVDRLHLEKSFDLAVTLSARHHKLADLIEDAKERKFAVDEEEEYDEEEYPEESSPDTRLGRPSSSHITPEPFSKRSMGLEPNPIPKKPRLML
jgi:hypothetical protein